MATLSDRLKEVLENAETKDVYDLVDLLNELNVILGNLLEPENNANLLLELSAEDDPPTKVNNLHVCHLVLEKTIAQFYDADSVSESDEENGEEDDDVKIQHE